MGEHTVFYLGDRVNVNSLHIEGSYFAIAMTTQDPNDAMCDPGLEV